jgi:hypothetical protein
MNPNHKSHVNPQTHPIKNTIFLTKIVFFACQQRTGMDGQKEEYMKKTVEKFRAFQNLACIV